MAEVELDRHERRCCRVDRLVERDGDVDGAIGAGSGDQPFSLRVSRTPSGRIVRSPGVGGDAVECRAGD